MAKAFSGLGSRQRILVLAGAALALATGLGAISWAANHQDHAPQPSAAVAGTVISAPPVTSAGRITPVGPILARSLPTSLAIPAIGVSHALSTVGVNKDGTIQVPPLGDVSVPAWYKLGPTPGQLGPAVIVGHIDSASSGAGVFFKLGALKPGNQISVTRADKSVAVFTVTGVREFSKNSFPTSLVYGNTVDSELRIITCGGTFNSTTHSYDSNIVAFARLTSSHAASGG